MTTETELQIELASLPDSFARVCDDGYWLLRRSGTATFDAHDSRYVSAQEVYSADQMRAYGEAAYRAGYERRYLENLGALA